VISGFLLAISCGLCWGIFLAPMRKLKAWEWENIWAVWSIVGMLAGPVAVALWLVPHFIRVCAAIGPSVFSLTLVIGAAAGISGFLYSSTVPVIGLGLATALNAGSSMVMALLPLIVLHRETIPCRSGQLTIAGVALALGGIALCGRGGSLRERELNQRPILQHRTKRRLSFVRSVVFCIIAGCISSAMNVVLAFPNPIFDVARKWGSSDFGAANAFLAIYLAGGFFSNFLYAVRQLYRNNTFSRFFAPGALLCSIWSIIMGGLFVFGATSYAGAVALLGSFGAIITWGVSMAATILTSSLWDLSQSEWAGRPAKVMALGITVLMAGVAVLGFAQYFHQINH